MEQRARDRQERQQESGAFQGAGETRDPWGRAWLRGSWENVAEGVPLQAGPSQFLPTVKDAGNWSLPPSAPVVPG